MTTHSILFHPRNLIIFLLIPLFLFSSWVCAQKKVDSKYPDLIFEAYYSGYFNVFDGLYGGKGIDHPIRMDVNKILGENKEKWFVSLPTGSYIILQYTDNEIFDAPNQNDIFIEYVGCCDEYIDVSASYDGKVFTYLGRYSGCDNEIDLAKTKYKQPVRFLKIEGLDVKCSSPGFDLVSAYALPGANRELFTGMEEVDTFFENKNDKRALIMENVYFENDSYEIKDKGVQDLDIIISKLEEFPEINVLIHGHTDSNASESYNQILSENRAKSVKSYLISKGINPHRIESMGFGESKPLRPNDTEEGRAINRRVELRKK
ncbi:MAG: OmpA family protein [Flavobacteriaceae bacterium]|nr:OmpA family protein [Flavobacteriaceae bacterium]